LNLYLISQTTHDSYDTYDSAVVAAPDEETARDMYPGNGEPIDWTRASERNMEDGGVLPDHVHHWVARREDVNVRRIGTATPDTPQGVICASYSAG